MSLKIKIMKTIQKKGSVKYINPVITIVFWLPYVIRPGTKRAINMKSKILKKQINVTEK